MKNDGLPWAATFALALLASLVRFPPVSKWGGPAEFTFAIASQDMPSGFYYDRDFDWPTGEVSVLMDVPVWPLHLLLLLGTAFCIPAHFRRRAWFGISGQGGHDSSRVRASGE